MIGRQIGPYEVLTKVGEGGMGEVYQARDTKLNRVVALKTLPPAFAADPDRIARFRREAQVLASLNHPNIAAIYGFEESPSALVMEFVPGRTLAEAMTSPLPLADALGVARQIATALEAAHEQSIVHRDLKPANVKITDDGTVKVLDFGLAKALSDTSSGDAAATMTSPAMTGVGVILGTARYMAPEQAKGKPVDRRADIWALGVILFEMLSGRPLYRGDTVTETIAHVITQPPSWDALPAATPSSVRRLLRRCLEKDPKSRLQSAGDMRLEIQDILATPAEAAAGVVAGPQTPRWQRVLPWALAALLAASLVVALWPRPATAPRPIRLDVQLGGEKLVVDPDADGPIAVISPDGQTLAYLGVRDKRRQLYVRPLDQLEATVVPGTDDALQPFFSPEGRSIAFFVDGTLKRVDIAGGAPVPIATAVDPRGGSWGPDDTIVLAAGLTAGLSKVSAKGGTPVPVTKLAANERTHRWPVVLPGGKAALFMCQLNDAAYDDGTIEAARLDTGERTVLVRGGTAPAYVPGYLLYTRRSSVFAVPFDPERLKITGEAHLVLSGVISAGAGVGAGAGNGGSQLSIAANGTAVYIPGTTASTDTTLELAIVDRHGKSLYSHPARRAFRDPRFSPNGKLVAIRAGDGKTEQLHLLDPVRGTLTKITFEGTFSGIPIWSPDGRQIAFASDRTKPGMLQTHLINSDGTGTAKALVAEETANVPTGFSPDGGTLVISEFNAKTNLNLLLLKIADGTTAPFLATPAIESVGDISPNGNWMAYQAQEAGGNPEIFVRAYPGGGGLRQVSSGLAVMPFWTKNGSEIVYATPAPSGVTIMAVSTKAAGATLDLGTPEKLFELPIATPANAFWFHVNSDASRFVVALTDRTTPAPERRNITVVFNFLDEIRRTILLR